MYCKTKLDVGTIENIPFLRNTIEHNIFKATYTISVDGCAHFSMTIRHANRTINVSYLRLFNANV